jgi:hypothetical protein
MDCSENTTTQPNCPFCGTNAGKPTGAVRFAVTLSFSPAFGNLSGERHRRHDELVAEVSAICGHGRCLLHSVEAEDDRVSYLFVAVGSEAPTQASFADLSQGFGPFMLWLTTPGETADISNTSVWLMGNGNSLDLSQRLKQADATDAVKPSGVSDGGCGQQCVGESHEHEWVAFSTALGEGWIMLQCVRCGRHGTVDDPSKTEWSDAFHAPSAPYRWTDDGRVTRRDVGPLYVRANEQGGYDRLWREVIGKLEPLDDDERAELLHLAGLAEGPGDLDSGLLPHFVRMIEQDTGFVPCDGVKRAAERIGRFHQKGLQLSPRQVAWALRCYATESPPAAPAAAHERTLTNRERRQKEKAARKRKKRR